MELILFVVGALLYLGLAYVALRFVVPVVLPPALAVGVVVGALAVLAIVAVTLTGVRQPVLPTLRPRSVGPDDDEEALWLPRPRTPWARTPYPRDRAWPHYLAAQGRLDLAAAARSVLDLLGRLWRRVAGDVADTPSILLLGPLLLPVLSALLGFTGGVLAAGALLLGSLAAVLAVAGGCWALVGLAVRGVDIGLQRRRHAQASCARCYGRTVLPVHLCPCGEPHRDVRDVRLGVLVRRCRCLRALPTTVRRAAGTLDARCPWCAEALPAEAGWLTDVPLPVFGPVSAGKTRLIFAGLLAVQEHVERRGGSVEPAGAYSSEAYAAGAEVVRSGADTAKTADAAPPVALTMCVATPRPSGSRPSGSRPSAFLHVLDAAGEVFSERARSARLRFLDDAPGLVLVLDPFSISAVAEALRPGAGEALRAAHPAAQDPETAYNLTVQRLRDHGTVPPALAVALVKADLLRGLPLAEGLAPDTAAVRAWLVEMGLDNLVRHAERDFAAVRYFLVSSTTGWRAEDPASAGEPLRWLAGRCGVLL